MKYYTDVGFKGAINKRVAKVKKENNIKTSHIFEPSTLLKYHELEKYKIGDIITVGKKEWEIVSINDDIKKLYHCIDKNGFRSSFHALEIVGVKNGNS